MLTLTIASHFPDWRTKARALLRAQISPSEVLWQAPGQASLFDSPIDSPSPIPPPKCSPPQIPRDFLTIAQTISHHASPDRWALLYQTLWRLTHGREKNLLKIPSDPTIARLHKMRKDLSRDIHKMHAFVRFKKTGEDPATDREQFMAWFEPDHHIMPLTARFFQKRFTGMDWTIFTPTGSATWDGKNLHLGPGVEKVEVPEEELDALWRGYYKSIFNPARLKTKAMQAEMPKKYWKNLPEADLIESLIAESQSRVQEMHQAPLQPPTSGGQNPYLKHLHELTSSEEKLNEPSDPSGGPSAQPQH